ncbi:MAG TPA: hypothetical protein EYP30_05485 [Archaeoglobaceae archaeon]|nr:hypothetical protein [Archaeoglobaceae archaeon]
MSSIRIIKKRDYPKITQGGLASIGSLVNVYKREEEEVETFRSRIKSKLPTATLSPTKEGLLIALSNYGIPVDKISIEDEFPAKILVEILSEAVSDDLVNDLDFLLLHEKPAGVGYEIFFKIFFEEPPLSEFSESFSTELLESPYFVISRSRLEQNKLVL